MGSNKLFVAFGFLSASCCLSLLFTARFRYRSSSYGTLSKATGFLLVARYTPSLRTAICSKQISKSSEMNL